MTKLVLNTLLSLTFAACLFADVGIELGREFTVKKGETATLSGSDLKIKMLRAGRSQRSKGGDIMFCTIDLSGGQEVTLDVGESAAAGNKNVKLTKVDLTTSPQAKDPWETNACSFVVTKAEK
jgi:hypothetical protein